MCGKSKSHYLMVPKLELCCRRLAGLVGKGTFLSYSRYEVVRGLWKGVGDSNPFPQTPNHLRCGVPAQPKFDTYQCRLSHLALDANSYTAIGAIQGDMGWSNFGTRVDSSKLKYLGLVYHLPKSRPAKRVCEYIAGNPRELPTKWFRQTQHLKWIHLPMPPSWVG